MYLDYGFFRIVDEALFFSQEILCVLQIIQEPFSALAPPRCSLKETAWETYTITFWMPTEYTVNRIFFRMGMQVRPYPMGRARERDIFLASPSLTLLKTNLVSGISLWDPATQSGAWAPPLATPEGQMVEQPLAQLRLEFPGILSHGPFTIYEATGFFVLGVTLTLLVMLQSTFW